MKEETRHARQLFLFGEGNNPPIKNINKLSKVSGVPLRTLRDHVKKWRQEAENLALSSPDSPYTLSLSPEVLQAHQEEIEFLYTQVIKLRKRVKMTKSNSPNYPVYLSTYQSALAKWESASGILAHYNAATAAMREAAKTKARILAKQSGAGEGETTPPRQASSGRFDTGE